MQNTNHAASLSVTIPANAYYDVTTYLEHNCQFPNVEYTEERSLDKQSFVITFNSVKNFNAFVWYWKRIVLLYGEQS